ncbi:MAG: cupin domain-containing protein [Deltaproteobacteria bacterium]|nr:cupin domain-containing protein [Deltaproteobacteria bacterium]
MTAEGCYILEVANDPDDETVSIARARVEPGVTTAWHRLRGISERYIIISGAGRVDIAGLPPTKVNPGDVVLIPPETNQRIRNTGERDLVFYCVCSPRFRSENYFPGLP